MRDHAWRLMLAEIDEQLTVHFDLVSSLLDMVMQQEFILEKNLVGSVARLNIAKRAVLQKMQANAKSADNLNKRWLRIRRSVQLSERRRMEGKIGKIICTVDEIIQKEKTSVLRLRQARHRKRALITIR